MSGMDVDSTVKINIPAIEDLTAAAERALVQTAIALLKDVKDAEVIPFETSNLQDQTFVDDSESYKGIVSIISDTPYARRWYYNPDQVQVSEYTKKNGTHVDSYIAGKATFNQSDHTKARDHWYEPWLEGGQKENFAAEKFAEIFKKESGL